jgi:uncharacterized membrane protein YgcG
VINDVDVPESDGWWIQRLADALMERRKRIQPLWDRHKGNPPLPELGSPAASRNRERVWKAFQQKARMNLAELVTRTVAERLEPIGCRVETDQATIDSVAVATGSARQVGSALAPVPNDTTNALARRIWAANSMDVQASEVIEKMLVMGESYTITGPPRTDAAGVPVRGALPIITAEDPRWVITEQDPEMPQRVIMGLKLYYDPIAQRDVGWLYPPGRAVKFERTGDSVRGTSSLDVTRRRFRFDPRQWEITVDRDLSGSIGDRCAVARFANHDSEGEFENHTDHLDRVNHMLLQRIVIATLQAFRQRAIKGVPTKDKDGNPIDYSDIFTNDPSALWLLPATAELWESGQVDLGPLLTSVRDDVRDLAAVLRMPVQHFMPDAANASAEGASSAKEGLIFRAKDRRNRCSSGFAEAFSLAFGYLPGTEGDDPLTITTLWSPIERFSLSERYAAAAQAVTAGLPWESRMVDVLQYEPDDLPRLRAQRADDLIFAPETPATTGTGAAGGSAASAGSPGTSSGGSSTSSGSGSSGGSDSSGGSGSSSGSSGS